jgi:hypothetical protein
MSCFLSGKPQVRLAALGSAVDPCRVGAFKIVSFDSQHMRANLWMDDLGILSFQNALLKFIYYLLKY